MGHEVVNVDVVFHLFDLFDINGVAERILFLYPLIVFIPGYFIIFVDIEISEPDLVLIKKKILWDLAVECGLVCYDVE